MTIKNIEELFVHDGRDFVTEAYLNLLKREPDEHGLMYYLGRLAQGHSKSEVIAQLAQSPECCPHDDINGIKNSSTIISTHYIGFGGGYLRKSGLNKT
jgi:hypothetical protein